MIEWMMLIKMMIGEWQIIFGKLINDLCGLTEKVISSALHDRGARDEKERNLNQETDQVANPNLEQRVEICRGPVCLKERNHVQEDHGYG